MLKFPRRNLLPGAIAALALLAALPGFGDDRDVLRDSASKPYLFVLLDTSGSMNWAPKCTQEDYDTFYDHDGDVGTPEIRRCNFVCEPRDCPVPRDGDDPASKFRQSKEALYEVLKDVDDVDFGFATFNQDNLRASNKHWLYRVDAGQTLPTLDSGQQWPVAGSEEVFGATIGCDRGNGDDNEMGCFADSDRAADTNDRWELTKVRRLPKLGANRTTLVSYWIRDAGRVYFVETDDPGAPQALDANITVHTHLYRCTGSPADNPSNGCNVPGERTILADLDITYSLVGDFLMWDFQVSRNAAQGGWFGALDTVANNVCEGWDPNDDSNLGNDAEDDDWVDPSGNSYNLKQTTVEDPYNRYPTNPAIFRYGDVVPLDWNQSNKKILLDRLAPRLGGGDPTLDPEAFGDATYLNDFRSGSDQFLRLRDSTEKSLVPNGSTPLGWSLKSFREWYRGCENGSCPGIIGWDDVAATQDPSWGCRKKYLVVLTDGDDTCPGRDPCSLTASMRALDDIYTYVVAFGVENTAGNRLNCMAANGGTGEPIYPQNKQELVDALRDILGSIREQAAAFASAAVPQVQANATDKIFLSSFTPLNDSAYWAGSMDAYLKPLPLDEQNKPNKALECSTSLKSGCYLWDAGDVQLGHSGGGGVYAPEGFLLQAPHPDDLAAAPPWVATDLLLGTGANERRLIYSQFNEPGNRRLFTYPTDLPLKYDLWTGLGIAFIVGDTTSEDKAEETANATIVKTLREKEGVIDIADPDNPGSFIQQPITFLLGDIFHTDPLILARPGSFSYYTEDPYLGRRLCGAVADPTRFPPPSYRWFADRHFCRRSLLVTAANEGQLHAFDAGIFRDSGGFDFECLLPAKDLDADGTAEADEFSDGVVDYDLNDDVDGQKSCTTDSDCASGPCEGGFCRDVRVGVIDGAFDNGSGREAFGYIPRAMLPAIANMAAGADRNKEFWGMDGGLRSDDVFIDPLASDAGSVACLKREWRSVLVGAYREGGPGYFALDVTQPDRLNGDHIPVPTNGYVPSCFDGGGACANRPYPAVLWEFQDRAPIEISPGIFVDSRLDEDLNDVPDLGNSWSKAATGRIRVCTGSCTDDDAEDRFVAIFGGGVGDDPTIATGNFIYMVDIETGKTIYKKALIGAAPADVAAIDTNGDAYIDRLYIGTTAGLLYKVELEKRASDPMQISPLDLKTRLSGVNYQYLVDRIVGPTGDEAKYDPFQLFSTGGRPIYEEVTAIFVSEKNRVAMAFGTGNRWNLWDFSGQQARFYMLLDDDFHDTDRDGVLDVSCGGCTEPLTESNYTAVLPDSANDPATATNLLYDGDGVARLPGWYIPLDANEKLITEAFSLAGITFFTSYQPTEVANDDGTCSRAGASRVFIVGTVTALGYSIPPEGTIADRGRYTEVPQFTTPPFVEQSATKNPEDGGSGTQHADFITDTLAIIRDELKSLQSKRCRYANYTQNIKTIRSDTGVVFIAPVPLCIDPTSWKEF